MNQESFYKVIKIVGLLFLLTSLYGIVSLQLMPIYQLLISVNRFSLESIITGKTFIFLNIVCFAFLLSEPKKISLFAVSSVLINLISIKIISNEWEIFYSINIAGLTFTSAFIIEYIKNKTKRSTYNYALFISIIFLLFGYLTVTTLTFMIYLIPNVNDTKALFIDNFYYVPKATNKIFYFFNDYIKTDGYIEKFFFYIYSVLGLGVFLLAFWEYTEKKKRYFINTLSSLSVLFVIGVLAYVLFPIMGPKYLDLSLNIESNKNIIDYLNNTLSNSIYARNGMPSLHFALSLILLLNSQGLSIIKRIFFIIFFILTAMATIVLKEHYFIDWIGAMPFVIITLLLADKKLNINKKKYLLIFNFSNLIIWYLFLWFSVDINSSIWSCLNCREFNISMSVELYIISALTIFNLIYSYKKLYKLGNESLLEESNIQVIVELKEMLKFNKKLLSYDTTKISLLFILSGFSSLIYQLVWCKWLINIFGSLAINFCIILATYMIGLSIGALLATKKESQVSPILRYALCEGVISFYCLLSPFLFIVIDKLYIYLISENIDNYIYNTIIKIILSILVLIIPSIFMGMTTPILLKYFNKESNSMEFSKLYTLKKIGAAIGTLISGYIMISFLGLKNTIYITVLLNLLITVFAINIYIKNKNNGEDIKFFIKEFFINFKKPVIYSENLINKNFKYYIGITTLFILGVLSFLIGVLYTYSLLIVVGSSTYVFSIILSIFLGCLAFGENIGKKIITKVKIELSVISYLFLMLGLSFTCSYFLINLIPEYFSSFSQSEKFSTFESRELLKFIACFVVLFIPVSLTRIIHTITVKYLNESQDTNTNTNTDTKNPIGHGIFINTMGSIIGLFLGNFYFINQLHINTSFKVIALVTLCVGLILNMKYKIKNNKFLLCFAIIIIIFLFIPYKINIKAMTSGSSINFLEYSPEEVLEYNNNVDGGLISINSDAKESSKRLLINGILQSSNNDEEIIKQKKSAIIPILNVTNKNNALIIGYGTGIKTKIFHDANFKNIDVIELNSNALYLADKYFDNNIREYNNVKTYITDGRNYLKLTEKKYDLVSVEMKPIWSFEESSLYNKEFYEIVKEKLNSNGILQQTIPLNRMNPNDFNLIINTVHNQFKYIYLYYVENKIIIVAMNSESFFDLNNIDNLNNNKNLLNIKSYYEEDFLNATKKEILKPEEVDKMLLKIYGKNINYLISTDDNLYLKYNTPKSNVLNTDTEKIIIKNLLKYQNK